MREVQIVSVKEIGFVSISQVVGFICISQEVGFACIIQGGRVCLYHSGR